MCIVFVCLVLIGGLVLFVFVFVDSNSEFVDVFFLWEMVDFFKQIEQEFVLCGVYVVMVFWIGWDCFELFGDICYIYGVFWVYVLVLILGGGIQYGYVVYNFYYEIDLVILFGLYQDWLLDFMCGDIVGQVGVIIFNWEMQNCIFDVIVLFYFEVLYNFDYFLLFNLADGCFQNCMEFMFDVVFLVIW